MKDLSSDIAFDSAFAEPELALPARASTEFGAWQRRALACGLGLCAGLWLLFLAREPNPAISPDSVSYLSAAESLAHGQGLRVPFAAWSDPETTTRLRHFPPGFASLVAVPIALGVAPVAAARAIEALTGGLSAALVVLIATACVPGSSGAVAGALAVIIAFLTPAITRSHTIVLSEPLFLMLFLSLLWLMVSTPKRAWTLGCVAAAAAMVRYAGIALVPAVVLFVSLQRAPARQRITRASCAALPALLAIFAWHAWTGSFRRYGYQPGLLDTASEVWPTLATWLVPTIGASPLRTALAFALLVSIALAWRAGAIAAQGTRSGSGFDSGFERLLLGAGLACACYAAVVVASRLFADPDIPFDWRLLAPLLLAAEITFSIALVRAFSSFTRIVRSAAVALLALWLGGSGFLVLTEAADTHAHIWGYTGVAWQRSELAGWLRHDSGGYELYSDDPAAIWQLARRQSRTLPITSDAPTLDAFARSVEHKRVALLGFTGPLITTAAPELLARALGLRPLQRFDKATLWVSER